MTLWIGEISFKDFKDVRVIRGWGGIVRSKQHPHSVTVQKTGLTEDMVNLGLRATGADARHILGQLYGLGSQDVVRLRSDTQFLYLDQKEVLVTPVRVGEEEELSPFYFAVPFQAVHLGRPGNVRVLHDLSVGMLVNDFYADGSAIKEVVWLPPQATSPKSALDGTVLAAALRTRTASIGDGQTGTMSEYDLGLGIDTGVENISVSADPKTTDGGENVRVLGSIKVFVVDTSVTTDYTVVTTNPLPAGWKRIAPGQVPNKGANDVLLYETGGLMRVLEDGRCWNFVGGAWEEKCTMETVGILDRVLENTTRVLKVSDGVVEMTMRPGIPHVWLEKSSAGNYVFSGFTDASDTTDTSLLSATFDKNSSPDNYVFGTKSGQTGRIIFAFEKDNGWSTGSSQLTIKNTERVSVGIIPEEVAQDVEDSARRMLKDVDVLGESVRLG